MPVSASNVQVWPRLWSSLRKPLNVCGLVSGGVACCRHDRLNCVWLLEHLERLFFKTGVTSQVVGFRCREKRSSYAIRPNAQRACADGFWICRQSIAFLHAQRLQLICFSVSGPRPTDSPSSAGLLLPACDVPQSSNRVAADADHKAVLIRTNGATVANVPVLLVSFSLSARLASSNPR